MRAADEHHLMIEIEGARHGDAAVLTGAEEQAEGAGRRRREARDLDVVPETNVSEPLHLPEAEADEEGGEDQAEQAREELASGHGGGR